MKPFMLMAPVLAALVALPVASLAAGEPAAANSRGEAKLAKMLEGRVAGEPVSCLRPMQQDRMSVIDGTAFVFRDGRTIWVNRPASARFLDDSDIPVFTLHGSSLCRLDQVEMRDRTSMMRGPVFVLEEFVPYTRPAEEG